MSFTMQNYNKYFISQAIYLKKVQKIFILQSRVYKIAKICKRKIYFDGIFQFLHTKQDRVNELMRQILRISYFLFAWRANAKRA